MQSRYFKNKDGGHNLRLVPATLETRELFGVLGPGLLTQARARAMGPVWRVGVKVI